MAPFFMNIDDFTLVLSEQSEVALAMTLALMMFSVALGLKVEHFAFFKQQPRVFFTGIFRGLAQRLPAILSKRTPSSGGLTGGHCETMRIFINA